MSDLRTARLALADLLKRETKLQVTPHPPRTKVVQRQIFFGARNGEREGQGGADRTTIPVVIALPYNTDDQFDVLDEYIDGTKSLIDIIDANPTIGDDADISVSVAGEWSEELIEIETIQHLGLVINVELRY